MIRHIVLSIIVALVVLLAFLGVAALFDQLSYERIADFFGFAALPAGVLAGLWYGLAGPTRLR